MTDLPPIRREVLLDADPATAFTVFTAQIGTWWPLAELSVFGGAARVAFADGRIVETSADGEQTVWGTVTLWEEAKLLAFSWHPSRDAERASQVEVTFTAVQSQTAQSQTLVTLTHSGWEVFEEPVAARAEYEQGWPGVLELYREYAVQFAAVLAALGEPDNDQDANENEDEGDDDTWVALLHHPGPAAPTDGSLFEDPRIGDHFTFLARMREAGYLVAAGPLADELGAGMTVLRLPGPGRLAEATRLATEDDASVAGGFFTVTVRPWQVAIRA